MALEVRAHTRVGAFDLAVEMRVEPHSTTAVLGPSGSGKTLTLRTVAGLATPVDGRISIDGRALFDSAANLDRPPRERRAGFVFQDYALFPHLSVAANLAYGFPGARRAARSRVGELVGLLGLGGLESRRPPQLSGGQRQRVALGRALAADPAFLLLDEPFSALDAPTRAALTEQLIELESRVGVPTVLVTHDLAEAHALAQRLIVLDDGVVLQSGPRDEVFGRPLSPRVGELLGVRNLLPASVVAIEDGVATADAAGLALRASADGLSLGERVTAGVRARDVLALPDPDGNARLLRDVDAGLHRTLVLALNDGSRVHAEMTPEAGRRVGRQLPAAWRLSVVPDAGFLWKASG